MSPTGAPNARFRVLELLHKHFGPGDKLMETSLGNPYVYAQAFLTRSGKREVLLVNKRDRTMTIPLGEAGKFEYVDQTTGGNPPASTSTDGALKLNGSAVGVITFP
jgi:hypothetical protein